MSDASQNSTVLVGDCLEVMPTLGAETFGSIVTDPPYGLGFMGKEWDHAVPGVEFWAEAIRVAKPGAHLVAFGGTRLFHRLTCAIEDAGWEVRDCLMWVYGSGFPKSHNLKDEWSGYGTALKPAWEPIILARKPLVGTVAANVQTHGVGALNIDGCRVGDGLNGSRHAGITSLGRWPANVVHDGSDEVVDSFPIAPGQQGDLKGHSRSIASRNGCYGKMPPRSDHAARGDSGSAARFFYCAKASKRDRNDGAENRHPTVKPTEIMRWLVRLVTPPNETVLDPFAGSGSTGRASVLEGRSFVGIELDPEHARVAEARIRAVQPTDLFAEAAS